MILVRDQRFTPRRHMDTRAIVLWAERRFLLTVHRILGTLQCPFDTPVAMLCIFINGRDSPNFIHRGDINYLL